MERDSPAPERIELRDLTSPERLAAIHAHEREFYFTRDWSPEMYVALARAGFISVATELLPGFDILIPQMQAAYAVLDWERLRVSRSMRRWMRSDRGLRAGYRLSVGHRFEAVYEGIAAYHEDNWMSEAYFRTLRALEAEPREGFELLPVGLLDCRGELVAGEVGYRIGAVYTSLTGFSDRKQRNLGKLQLFLLGEHLREAGYAFWNLGHPHMQYKLDLGARVLERKDFLKRWKEGISREPGENGNGA